MVGTINSGLGVLGPSILLISDLHSLEIGIIILPLLMLHGIIIHYYIYHTIASRIERDYIEKRLEPEKRDEKGNYVQ